MFRSIQWKLVSIYILLILLAMEVVGVYLVQSIEKYHVNKLSDDLDIKAQLMSDLVKRYLYPIPSEQGIDDLIKLGQQAGTEINYIVILDETASIITSNDETKFQKGVKLLTPEITQATFGSEAMDIREDPRSKIRYMYLAYPVKNGSRVVGIIYLISSMENIYKTISNTKAILFVATLLALMITGILGYALSKTITGPIQEVTRNAALMAQGNFDRKIQVRSNDEIGKLTGMFNFLTTRLKETMEEISDEKEKMEAILTNMADGVIALNSKGEVIHINPAARQMLSLDKDPTGENFEPALKELFKINLEEFLGEDCRAREVLVKKGEAVLKSIIAPLKRESRVIGLILVLQDITRQFSLENMRKEFVANVSHELRTPLTTIKSYAETLLDGAMDEPSIARQFMSVVYNEAERMTRLVNDLLELSRLDNKETRWDKKPISPSGILKDVISKMLVNIKKKNLALETDILQHSPDIFADRDKIEQVFQNILSNAIKYTPEGGKIFIRLDSIEDRVRIIFGDTGIGIPKEDLPRLFERFYRVDKTRSRELGGTGLGLSIAKEIVEAHDGIITIDSELGHGTQVTILLPAVADSKVSNM
ncbi:HAMP domain-containing protein [Biomaibacter acetigenes]|uniref:histidine kinase n=1 Tax=Biomaibacter acetigenes TaxID=2316383 RepID=A0A3G2R9B8_9FIRM|nr:ATP-binding protein [Biomaibacter acetigenes]AYO32061.1 HAMP domain-containing protein [Biomaibacter acetigenes]MDN5312094.1 two-component system, OmpR family, sensor histidine kinase VicK [Thermoanaerobacteraceae bacterium]RKL62821.1 cell wall metabolism sensor histidine kinase WalK [Thermoanaerobacteraceae bacterium SP2]